MVCDGEQGRRVAFVEVKKTADSSYISDSVYKALGYLSDFRTIWAGIPSNPKIVVLFPEAIAPKAATNIAEQEVILASSADRATVSAALRAGLGL